MEYLCSNNKNKILISPSSQSQNPSHPILPICGLGASVGCERFKRTFNTPRLKSQIGSIGWLEFVSFATSKINILEVSPLTQKPLTIRIFS